MDRYAAVLRGVAERAHLLSIRQVAAQPGVKAVYRATLHHIDFRAADVVVTLRHIRPDDAMLESIYVGHFGHHPITRRMPDKDFAQWMYTLQSIRFDTLEDQSRIPLVGSDLCWVERAAGSFWHGVIFSPQGAEGRYHTLQAALRTYLPEVFREIK